MYYADVFLYDWYLAEPIEVEGAVGFSLVEYKNPLFIVFVFGMTFSLIAIDWRKRKWS